MSELKKEVSLRELQLTQIDMLKELLKIFAELDIKCYALGGTVLGAVRHQGFIPWDDDIDLGLPREDYEKFLKYGQEAMSKKLFLQTYNTDENYMLPIAKVRLNDSIFMEKTTELNDIHHGVYIDIFHLDNGIVDAKKSRKLMSKLKVVQVRISKSFIVDEPKAKSVARKLITMTNMHRAKYYVEKNNLLVQRYNNIAWTHYCNYNGAWGTKELIAIEVFGDGIMLPFEDVQIRVPSNHHEYLKSLYGDYMALPPEENRCSHHGIIEIKLP